MFPLTLWWVTLHKHQYWSRKLHTGQTLLTNIPVLSSYPSVLLIWGAQECVLCVTRQRWAQIKGLCQVLIRSAPMFVFQYQRLHDLLVCVGAPCCRVLTLPPTPNRGVYSSEFHANEATMSVFFSLCMALELVNSLFPSWRTSGWLW